VQRVQTDRGGEFFASEVQNRLRDRRIKFRPNRPRAPHLNGEVERVERVQRTALEEFWPTVALEAPRAPRPTRGLAPLLQPATPAYRARRQDTRRAH
jgi:transposase InsO family protein